MLLTPYNNRVRKIDLAGMIQRFRATGTPPVTTVTVSLRYSGINGPSDMQLYKFGNVLFLRMHIIPYPAN